MIAASSRRRYLIAAATIAAMTSISAACSYFRGAALAEEVVRLYSFLMAILTISWLVADPEIPVDQKPSFDHGGLVWVTFPLLAVYQMYSAHRWRGMLILLGLAALYLAPDIVVVLLMAFTGAASDPS